MPLRRLVQSTRVVKQVFSENVGCFSFFPTKNLGGAGDGGMMTTDDPELAARLKRLRVHGDIGQYEHIEVGMNSRLDALQAAVLRVKLRSSRIVDGRTSEECERYAQMLTQAGLTIRWSCLPAMPTAATFTISTVCE